MQMVSWQMVSQGEPLRLVTQEAPLPKALEVRVAVAGCGVCHTDLGFCFDGVRTRAPLPLTLGHEISGVVDAVGAGAESWLGAAVIVPAVMPCGVCDPCKRGQGNICRAQKMPGNDIQGGFASHVVVPSRGLCLVPGFVSLTEPIGASGALLSELSVVADALTTPYQAIHDAHLEPEDMAIFVGVGGVGGFGCQLARAYGAGVVAVDIDQARLKALSAVTDAALNARDLDPRDLKKQIQDTARHLGKRPDRWKIFETSGTQAGQLTAFGLLTHGAHLAVVGFTMARVEVRLSNLMAFHATARGSWGCVPEHYPAALGYVLRGQVSISPYIERFPLADINRVFIDAHNHAIQRRPVLVP